MRLDVFLTEKGLCESRQRAKLLIESGLVMQNGRIAAKPAATVAETDRIEIVGEALSGPAGICAAPVCQPRRPEAGKGV